MSYVKHWAEDPKINSTEKKKLQQDGLDIFREISRYAREGFDSIPKEQWSMFKWAGLYLQKPREDGYFMMRVNVPSGVLNHDQVRTLAGVAKDFGRGVYDITTRQAVQFHWLRIEDIPAIFKRLEAVGLSSAGACGDITRNIVGNPLAGIDPYELVDTEPIVQEVYHYFQHNRDFSNLPRKYKISISSNIHNAAHAQINCLSLTPAVKTIKGETVKGFHIHVGGGLSARPYLAQELDLFIRPEQVKNVVIAVTTIFRDYGYRVKRTRARLKFLVADWGPDKFAEKIQTYTGLLPGRGESRLTDWNAGYFYGVHPQKQKGYSYVGLNVPIGRLSADDVMELARISQQYGQGEIRNCNSQNVIIPHISDDQVEEMLQEGILKRISIQPPPFMAYAVSCTGTEYCNLALTETKERMRRIAEYLDREIEMDVPVRIHMVGCPNSCGQRQIADIGLQGVKVRSKESGEWVDAFELYVGGTLEGKGVLNQKLKGKVEGVHLGPALREFLTFFKEEKGESEQFYYFVKRMGIERLQELWNEIVIKAPTGS